MSPPPAGSSQPPFDPRSLYSSASSPSARTTQASTSNSGNAFSSAGASKSFAATPMTASTSNGSAATSASNAAYASKSSAGLKTEADTRNGGTSPSGSAHDAGGAGNKKKPSKRRKVNLACIYCRRSHMTCDEGRPCQRCIKREIGHLCHDEATAPHTSTSRSEGGTPSKTKSASPAKTESPSHSGSQNQPSGPIATSAAPSSSPSSSVNAAPSQQLQQQQQIGTVPTSIGSIAGNSNTVPANAATNFLNSLGLAGSSNSPFLPGSTGPYSSVSPMSNLNQVNADFTSNTPIFKSQATGGIPTSSASNPFPLPSPGQLSAANMMSLASLFNNTFNANNAQQQQQLQQQQQAQASGDMSGLNGAGLLGLGGGPGGYEGGGSGFSGDSAGGNEFTLLSEFLESLDGPAGFGAGQTPNSAAAAAQQGFGSSSNNANNAAYGSGTSTGYTPSGSRRNTITGVENSANDILGTLGSAGSTAANPSRAFLGPSGNSNMQSSEPSNVNSNSNSNNTDSSANVAGSGKRSRRSSFSAAASSSGSYLPSLSGGSSKTERFFLTAADQKDGTRDERLARVIQAKYEAGLLRPYNHVNGYARLNRWMERNVSAASKRRILKPLSVFRPAFRAVAQSLTNIDLIFIEEAFERLLLDYDRVFSTQGIPACLWRRTGEIYKGNKEFADLIGVPIESLREGRLCIYELMAEESAVNYWEKYGAVSFDPGQKAVLTSCVLRTKNKSIVANGGARNSGLNNSNNSAQNAIAAQLPRSTPIGSGTITPTNGRLDSTTTASNSGSGSGGGNDSQASANPSSSADQQPDKSKDPSAAPFSNSTNTSSTTSSGAGTATGSGAASTAISSSTGATSTSGIIKDPTNPKAAFIHCCFSFTIRRDQWNIPTMIVGNFLPTNPV